MKYKIFNEQYLKCCAVVAVSASLSASELTVDFTNNAELAAPIAGKVKFRGSSASDVCTFSGSATGDVQVTLGKVAMSSGTPIASGKAVRLNGGDLVAAAGFSLPSIVMVQDGSLDAQNHSVDLNALSGSGKLTIIGDGTNVVNVKSDLSANTVGGINVDNGRLYLQRGKTPNAPINIASSAALQLGDASAAAVSEIPSTIEIESNGIIIVDANAIVSENSEITVNYTWNATSGHYTDGSGSSLAYPSNFVEGDFATSFSAYGFEGKELILFGTNDSQPAYIYQRRPAPPIQVVYGGLSSNTAGGKFEYWSIAELISQNLFPSSLFTGWAASNAYVFYASDPASSYSSTTPSGEVGIASMVLMQSGSKIQLGAGATWARNVTVTA